VSPSHPLLRRRDRVITTVIGRLRKTGTEDREISRL
jgi:hypothetical protein